MKTRRALKQTIDDLRPKRPGNRPKQFIRSSVRRSLGKLMPELLFDRLRPPHGIRLFRRKNSCIPGTHRQPISFASVFLMARNGVRRHLLNE
jgi:hypothetical protein